MSQRFDGRSVSRPPLCPGYDEMEGRCNYPVIPEAGLCTRCAQLEIARRPQGEREVRWPHGDMGEML